MDESTLLAQDTQLSPEVVNVQSVILLILYLLIFVVAIYFLTKFISKRSLQRGMKKTSTSRKTGSKWFSSSRVELGSLVSVADRIVVDKDKTIMVVEFKGQYYLMSTTGQDMHLIDKVLIPPEDIEARKEKEEADGEDNASYTVPGEEPSFLEYLKQLGSTVKVWFYKLFHKGKNAPPEEFTARLKEEMELMDAESIANKEGISGEADAEDK